MKQITPFLLSGMLGDLFTWLRPNPDSKGFGQSATCRRMVRKNKLRRLGIAGQRQ